MASLFMSYIFESFHPIVCHFNGKISMIRHFSVVFNSSLHFCDVFVKAFKKNGCVDKNIQLNHCSVTLYLILNKCVNYTLCFRVFLASWPLCLLREFPKTKHA